jgi:hypothetical protein
MSEYKYLNELRTEELIDEVKRRLGVRLIVVNEMPESAPDGSARLYMGETTADYTKGHIYQYNDTERVWNDVTKTIEVIKDVTVLPEGDEIKNIFYNLGADTWTDWNLEVNFDVHPDIIPYPTVPLTTAQFDAIGWVGYNGSGSARNSSLTFFADTKNPDAVKLGWFDGTDIVELYAVQYISSYDTQNNAKTRIRLFDTYENYQSNTDIHTYEYVHSDVDDKTTFTELRKWESSGIYAGNDTNDKLIRLATYADTIADYELSELSTKPVQNKVVTAALKDKVVRRFEMPVASEDNVGETVIYVGQTTEDYKLGHVYKSTGTLPGEYAWIDITSADVIVDVDELPTGAEIRDIIYRIAEAEYERVNIPMYENAKDIVDILTVYFGEPEISEGTSGGTLYAFACDPTANCVIRMGYDNYTANANAITNATVIANASGRLHVVKLQTVDNTTGRAYGREVIDGVSNTMRWEMPTVTDHYYMGDSTERKLDRIVNYNDDNVTAVIDIWDIPEKIEDVIYRTRAGAYNGGTQSINGLNHSVSVSADIQETIDAFTKFNYVIKERGVRNGFLIQTDTFSDTENEYEYCELTAQYTTISVGNNQRDSVLIQYKTDGTGGYVQLWNNGERYDMIGTTGTFNLRYVIPEEAYWVGNSVAQTLTRLATYDDKLTQYKTMPNITSYNREYYIDKVAMYIGETNENYICGHLYKGAILDTHYTYYWQDVTDVPTADAVVWVTDFPTAPDIKNVVYGKITTTTEYTNENTVALDELDTETRITLDGDNYIPAGTDDVYVKRVFSYYYEVFVSFNTTTNELTTSGGTYTLAAETELTFATQTTTETKSFKIGNEERQELTELESGGTEVIANPSETATETLSKVNIDGTVYEVGGDTIQVETLPTAGASEVGNIYQYIGATTATLTNGYFYECVEDSGSYSWVEKEVQKNDDVPHWSGTRAEYEAIKDNIPEGAYVALTDDIDSTYESGDYSTNEVNTGKRWIDGKPIYRKVLVFNNPKWDWTPNTFNIPDISQVVTANFIAYPDAINNPNFYWTENWTLIDSDKYLAATINSGRFLIKTNTIETTSDSKVIWIIEYTKND